MPVAGIKAPEFAAEIEDELEGAVGLEIHDRETAFAPEGIANRNALPGPGSVLVVANNAAGIVPGGTEEELHGAVTIHVPGIGEPAVELGTVLIPGKLDPGDGSQVAGRADLFEIDMVDRSVLVLCGRENGLGSGCRGPRATKEDGGSQWQVPHEEHTHD